MGTTEEHPSMMQKEMETRAGAGVQSTGVTPIDTR
jgi:hypothetical protein